MTVCEKLVIWIESRLQVAFPELQAKSVELQMIDVKSST